MAILPYPHLKNNRVESNDRYLAKEVRKAVKSGVANTYDGAAFVRPEDTTGNGFVVKAPSSTWRSNGDTNDETAQAFVLLKEGSPVDPSDSILFRVTGGGSMGLAGNIHLATGFRQDVGYSSTQALWIDPAINTVLVVMTPDSSQTSDLVQWAAPTGNARGAINAGGSLFTFRDDGTTTAAFIAATSAGQSGARALFDAGATTTIPVIARGVASQTADIFQARDSANAVLWRINAGGIPMARAFHSANQSITNATFTALNFNSERFDTDSIHDNAVNNNRFEINTAGVYHVWCSIEWAANATGRRELDLMLNGATAIASSRIEATGGGITRQTASCDYKFVDTDFVSITVHQTSGGALNVLSTGNYSPEAGIHYLGAG